eukprot:m.58092 g.58092  ORF g.58092 m.58092 type:complete len:230 (-) comp12159_c0_seq1:1622-2311(-)
MAALPKMDFFLRRDRAALNFSDTGITRHVQDAVAPSSTLMFTNCSDCTYIFETTVAKISIQNCTKCTFILNGKVLSGVVECISSRGIELCFSIACNTAQVDDSDDVSFVFTDLAMLGSVYWVNCNRISVVMKEGEARTWSSLPTDQRVQRRISVVDGAVTSEDVVRVGVGFPTTARENTAFEEQQARNSQRMMDFLRGQLHFSGRSSDSTTSAATRDAPGPDDSAAPPS